MMNLVLDIDIHVRDEDVDSDDEEKGNEGVENIDTEDEWSNYEVTMMENS